MRWRQGFLVEVHRNLKTLGLLTQCPVCASEAFGVDRRPAILHVGGLSERDSGPVDPEANIEFLVRLECTSCGYVQFFNSERHRGPNDRILVAGSAEAEQQAEIEHPWKE